MIKLKNIVRLSYPNEKLNRSVKQILSDIRHGEILYLYSIVELEQVANFIKEKILGQLVLFYGIWILAKDKTIRIKIDGGTITKNFSTTFMYVGVKFVIDSILSCVFRNVDITVNNNCPCKFWNSEFDNCNITVSSTATQKFYFCKFNKSSIINARGSVRVLVINPEISDSKFKEDIYIIVKNKTYIKDSEFNKCIMEFNTPSTFPFNSVDEVNNVYGCKLLKCYIINKENTREQVCFFSLNNFDTCTFVGKIETGYCKFTNYTIKPNSSVRIVGVGIINGLLYDVLWTEEGTYLP